MKTSPFVKIFSELGEMLLRQFFRFDNALYQSNWYLFPIETQRMLLIVIANAQQPIIIHGFGNVACTREVFKKVKENYNENDNNIQQIFILHEIHT